MIAIDDKTLRRSFDDAARINPLAVVTAFASASRMMIGQEASAWPRATARSWRRVRCCACLNLDGDLVTADALHCQRETAQLVRDRAAITCCA